jgi:hypothetical protein
MLIQIINYANSKKLSQDIFDIIFSNHVRIYFIFISYVEVKKHRIW